MLGTAGPRAARGGPAGEPHARLAPDLPPLGATDSIPLPVVPGTDPFGLPPAAAARDTEPGRADSLPGLLPGLPPEPVPPAPGGFGAPDPTGRLSPGRPTADRHKVLVDRRLLFAGGGILMALVILFGALAFTGGDGDSDAARPGTTPAGSASPSASPDGQSTGDPRDALRSALNPTVMTGCAAPQRSDSAYADATLSCRTPAGIEVTAFHFPNRSAVDRQIGARETYYVDEGNCDDGQQSSERWSSSAQRAGGNRLCYFFANRFYEFWTYDDSLVAFSVDDAEAGHLNAWWHSFDPLRH
ncbi:conserved hypothetical protein [Frankia canadensis]|uniref:Uncharacterized protein n=1 Tax=Frankia canadensis TaxID=1836972 RepID=A0A2I2KL52_9ACTN|nr:hypothetical protein [Frankia canadensis]SNQ46401.1 conserved hypothetical protein [Frankia canadensis]SOU53691.1 conserved hypothetical protein [Frankia canadensis]